MDLVILELSPFVVDGSDKTSMSELTHVSRPSSFDEALPLRLPLPVPLLFLEFNGVSLFFIAISVAIAVVLCSSSFSCFTADSMLSCCASELFGSIFIYFFSIVINEVYLNLFKKIILANLSR